MFILVVIVNPLLNYEMEVFIRKHNIIKPIVAYFYVGKSCKEKLESIIKSRQYVDGFLSRQNWRTGFHD